MHRHGRRGKWFLLKFFMLIVFVGLFSTALMLLWNWLIPEIFGLKSISYIQSLGILVLSKLLFSGFGRGHHFGHYGSRQWHRRGDEGAEGAPEQSA